MTLPFWGRFFSFGALILRNHAISWWIPESPRHLLKVLCFPVSNALLGIQNWSDFLLNFGLTKWTRHLHYSSNINAKGESPSRVLGAFLRLEQ